MHPGSIHSHVQKLWVCRILHQFVYHDGFCPLTIKTGSAGGGPAAADRGGGCGQGPCQPQVGAAARAAALQDARNAKFTSPGQWGAAGLWSVDARFGSEFKRLENQLVKTPTNTDVHRVPCWKQRLVE